MRRSLALLLLSLTLAGCSSPPVIHYILTSQSPHLCCRSERYAMASFVSTTSSRLRDSGVIVRLLGDTVRARCDQDAMVGVEIANNTPDDIYIPFSKELEGDRVKLYPWRLLYETQRPIRMARQLQYNDMVERQDALLQFFRLPAGREVRLAGMIPQRWLCAPTVAVTAEYLGYELDPVFYSDRTRDLRGSTYKRDPDLKHSIGFRYEVAYTTFGFMAALPVIARTANAIGDTVEIKVAVKEEPAHFVDDSQHVARSNEVVLMIDD